MFLRVLTKSIRNRPTRIAVAVLAVLLGASLVSALTSISLDARGKAGKELRAYGANIVLVPRPGVIEGDTALTPSLSSGQALALSQMERGRDTVAQEQRGQDPLGEQGLFREDDLVVLESADVAPLLAGYVPYLYGVVEVGRQQVVLAGTRFAEVRKVSPWWQVAGKWPEEVDAMSGPVPAILGGEVARKLHLQLGSTFEVQFAGRTQEVLVAGTVETGAAEDSQIFVGLRAAQGLLSKPGRVSLAQVSALTEKQTVAATAAAMEAEMPRVQARVIGQIADAESGVLGKVELLMAIVAVLVLFASTLTVTSTMTTTVLERTKEIGLLKALGASKARIALLFVAEAAIVGAFGGALGSACGFLTAQVVGQMVFDSAVAFQPAVVPLSIAVALGVSILASAIPVRAAVRVDPAITLRGE